MQKKAGPAAIVVAVVGLIAFLAVMYRVFFPPQPRSDLDNPNGMPNYARNFLKNHKAALPGGSMGGAASMRNGVPQPPNSTGSGH